MTGCQDEPPVAPEQRMRVISLAAQDRQALTAPRFAPFREALLRVRLKQSQRPVSEDGAVPAQTLAIYNSQLEAITIPAIQTIHQDGWSWEDRQLMNRAMRGATAEDLAVDPG